MVYSATFGLADFEGPLAFRILAAGWPARAAWWGPRLSRSEACLKHNDSD
jgi:hypothetical protein